MPCKKWRTTRSRKGIIRIANRLCSTMSDAEQTDDAELPLSHSSEEASKAVEDKAQASEPEKGEGGNEELEEGDGDEAAVDWWGGATSWMSSTVSSVSQVRLLSFKLLCIAYVTAWHMS